jgi:phytoene dehydrogenase-like protein
MSLNSYDTVIIGSGINALVAGAKIARTGLKVAILEANHDIGGFIASSELLKPGYVHDTYSSWHPLFVTGAAYAELGPELECRGLTYCNTEDAVTASISTTPSGEVRTVVGYRDVAKTVSRFEDPGDRAAYRDMLNEFHHLSNIVFGALGSELSPANMARLGTRLVRSAKMRGSVRFARTALMSGRSYVRQQFRGWEVDQLWTPWLLHAGRTPDSATGGMMIPVFAFSLHEAGLPIVKGGARNFTTAFAKLLDDLGVDINTGTRVNRIITQAGRAVGVETDNGDRFHATNSVLASVSPQALYQELLADEPSVAVQREASQRYLEGRAAMQIHLTLSGDVPWSNPDLKDVPLIHISDGSNSTAVACAQAEASGLPAEPTIVVGQQAVLDSSRAPAGASTLWVQLQEVPYLPKTDASGDLLVEGAWTEELKEQYLQRVLTRIETFAPGLRDLVTASKIISPADLEQFNANAVSGDPYGGSAEIHQNLLWRPFADGPSWNNPLKGLFHIGASVHPGPGLSGGSGYLAATRIEKHTQRRPAFLRGLRR